MPTPYSDIHQIFLSKISDYDILKFTEGERDDILLPYLKSACAEFNNVCKYDLNDRDDESMMFKEDLDDRVKEILATGECFYWVNPRVLNTEHLQLFLNTKDFNMASPANLLTQLRSLRNELKREFKQAIINYSYEVNDFKSLKE